MTAVMVRSRGHADGRLGECVASCVAPSSHGCSQLPGLTSLRPPFQPPFPSSAVLCGPDCCDGRLISELTFLLSLAVPLTVNRTGFGETRASRVSLSTQIEPSTAAADTCSWSVALASAGRDNDCSPSGDLYIVRLCGRHLPSRLWVCSPVAGSPLPPGCSCHHVLPRCTSFSLTLRAQARRLRCVLVFSRLHVPRCQARH
jgi:hypothetical protein